MSEVDPLLLPMPRANSIRSIRGDVPPQARLPSVTHADASVYSLSGLTVALLGTLALALAMGLGRFAYTPLLPLMLRDGSVTLAQGSWLATANYLGYFAGAALCSVLPVVWHRRRSGELPADRLALTGLLVTLVLLLAMVLPWPQFWPWVRFLAGVASAMTFVFVSAWCMQRLALRGAQRLGGLIYAGPGVGIVASGLGISALSAGHGPAWLGWLLLAAVCGLGVSWVGRVLARARCAERGRAAAAWPQELAVTARSAPHPAAGAELWQSGSRWLMVWMVVGYGLAGFGYIITATFQPVLAREALPDSAWVDWFWPLYGMAVIVGCLLATVMPQHWDNRKLLAGCYLMQALGVVMGLWWPSVAGFALGSILVGLPFTALTLFAVREIRMRWPRESAAIIALVTAAYALGQVLGPLLVSWLLHHATSRAAGFDESLMIAGLALLAGAVIWTLTLRWSAAPVR